jgi:hypothetical protein
MLFALFMILGLAAAVGSTLLYRYFTNKVIQQVFFPLRLPFWQGILGLLGILIGLVTMAIEVGVRGTAWRQSWGWWIFVSSIAGFLGAWLGGIVTSYVLQLLTGWPVAPPPPAPPKP